MSQPISQNIWFGKSWGWVAVRYALVPLSWLYASAWLLYRLLYAARIKQARHPHWAIVCIGNLTVGGSGKTPLVLHMIDLLRSIGREVVVSCSAYGSPAQHGAQMAPPGELDPEAWGDEPSMIRWLRPETPIICGRDRVKAAEICSQKQPKAVLLLDDGYQHLPLRKDISVVIEDPDPANVFCLPAGPYREPRSDSIRADLVVPLDWPTETIQTGFYDPDGPHRDRIDEEVALLCAIGSPEKFGESMSKMGLRIAIRKYLPDHDPLSAGTLFHDIPAGMPIVVTPKDWVKIRKRRDLAGRRFYVATQEVRFVEADKMAAMLKRTLDEIEAKKN